MKIPKYTKDTGKFCRFNFIKWIRISFKLILKSCEKWETLLIAIDFNQEKIKTQITANIYMPPPIGVGGIQFYRCPYVCTYVYVRPEIISITHFSATTYRNDLKFDMQLQHLELYRVCELNWCKISTSCLAGASVSYGHILFYVLNRQVSQRCIWSKHFP